MDIILKLNIDGIKKRWYQKKEVFGYKTYLSAKKQKAQKNTRFFKADGQSVRKENY